jgi:hypothetical protein
VHSTGNADGVRDQAPSTKLERAKRNAKLMHPPTTCSITTAPATTLVVPEAGILFVH